MRKGVGLPSHLPGSLGEFPGGDETLQGELTPDMASSPSQFPELRERDATEPAVATAGPQGAGGWLVWRGWSEVVTSGGW